jgi:hypothetical protein
MKPFLARFSDLRGCLRWWEVEERRRKVRKEERGGKRGDSD